MKLSNLFGPLTAFAFAVLLVVGATAGVAVVVDDSSNSPTQSNAQPFQTESLLPEPVSAEGTVTPPETTTQKTVVVDLSHGNDVSRTDIQPLVSALVSAGHEVRFFAGSSSSFGMSGSAGSELNTTLGEADAFVIVNPASSYSTEEVDGIEAFADAGGRVLLLADTPTQSGGSTAVIPGLSGSTTQSASGQPTNVAGRFGITFGAGYLYDMTENANNFQYVYGSASSDDDIATGSQQTVFREAVPLVTRSEVTTVLAADDVRRSSTRKNG
ncbi:hypothetical protein, partial [Haloferax profundi]|uniref:hypothetical protein n=1 Tax=Haloferax profundi TaxID=1544718 RepID=UPI0012FBC974